MNDLLAPRTALRTYLLVCGVAMALGWGIRGQFGHERGAMIPGVMAALAIALGSPDGRKRSRVASLGVAGGIGLAIGGSMSYGAVAGSLGQPGFHFICTVLLILKGAIWGGIGGGALGMAISNVRYPRLDWLWLPPLLGFFLVLNYLFPGGPLSRGDTTPALGCSMLLFLAWLRFVKRDRPAFLVAVSSMVGFGFGFPFGSWLCVLGERTGIAIDWWKVAEMTWGLCGGLSWGFAAYVLDEEIVRPDETPQGFPTWLGLVYIAWLVPFWNGLNAVTYWVNEKHVLPRWVIGGYLVLIVAVLVAGIAVFRPRETSITPATMTAGLLIWVCWSTWALQFLKMAFPGGVANWGFWWTQIAFLVCALILTLYAVGPSRNQRRTTTGGLAPSRVA